jgi:hypothetical protein
MTPMAQNTRSQDITIRTPNLQRPGRRTFSLTAGLGSILILVDAIFHPGPVSGLWTVQTIQDLSALIVYPVVAVSLAAVAYGPRSRRRTGTSASIVIPTPFRPARPRLHLVETSERSSRAA